MISGQLALVTAALFTGAAIYVSAVEHPARMALDRPRHAHGMEAGLQARLRHAGQPGAHRFPARHLGLLGNAELAVAGRAAWRLLAGWPYTLLVILPTNKRLLATPIEAANAETRALIAKWAALACRAHRPRRRRDLLFLWLALGGGGLRHLLDPLRMAQRTSVGSLAQPFGSSFSRLSL